MNAPAPPPGTRVTSQVVDSLAALLTQLLRFAAPADAVMSRHFRSDRQLGSRDRSLVAEAAFDALRRLASLRWIMQTADPLRAPHLAALIVLARQHGIAALAPRALRGNERAVKGALEISLRHAPAHVQAEVPPWLLRLVSEQYADARELLAALAQPAPLDLRVNTLKSDRAAVLSELRSATRLHAPLQAQATRFGPDAIRLPEKPALTRWPLYQDGLVEVQDEGSQLVARLVAPRRGHMVVDFCAGAGGKTLALGALMRSTGRIYAFDTHARRLAGLGPRLARSGLSNVHPAAISSENDPRVKRLAGKIDRVLVDAPCSGTGTLRRNPDLKWRVDEGELARLQSVQLGLLKGAARLLKPGARLVYSTCSVLAQENQALVQRFIDEQPQFALLEAAPILAAQDIVVDDAQRFAPWFVLLPHIHDCDGFFAAVLERKGS
ncbi:MAG TPA: RsmB/NOP family class I SAM-dependent RNA methyltransferase [Burkholderiaceae bacterium]|nr:RsmB/NOP family class I SAM-dependent RNA methyltransferase [Burkholderiaceae bacterium]